MTCTIHWRPREDKDKDKIIKRPNMCHIFENGMTQGCQICWWGSVEKARAKPILWEALVSHRPVLSSIHIILQLSWVLLPTATCAMSVWRYHLNCQPAGSCLPGCWQVLVKIKALWKVEISEAELIKVRVMMQVDEQLWQKVVVKLWHLLTAQRLSQNRARTEKQMKGTKTEHDIISFSNIKSII